MDETAENKMRSMIGVLLCNHDDDDDADADTAAVDDNDDDDNDWVACL